VREKPLEQIAEEGEKLFAPEVLSARLNGFRSNWQKSSLCFIIQIYGDNY